MSGKWIVLGRDGFAAAKPAIFDHNGTLHPGVELHPGSFGTPFYVRFDDPEEQEVFESLLSDESVRYHCTNNAPPGAVMRRGAR